MSRKPQDFNSLRRKKAFKAPRDRVLIVCEGEQTEPIYFRHLIGKLRISSAKVLVIGKECGSAPKSIVEYAVEKIRKEQDNAFDQVWCIFDVEIPPHISLDEAYNNIVSYTPPENTNTILKSAISNPCFEYWYILHFEKTSQTFASKKQLMNVLKKHIPSYDKANKKIPEWLYPKLEAAIQHAKEVIREKHCGDDLRDCNPSTHVHKLAEYLQEMARR